jgi:ribokinase
MSAPGSERPDGRVVVLGSLNMDLVLHLDQLPGPGQTVVGHDVELHPGGKGGNQAVAAAAGGASVAMVGRVGKDGHGDTLRAAMSGLGVDVDAVDAVPGMTGMATVMVAHDGENAIAVSPGANWTWTPDDLDVLEPLLDSVAVLVLQMEIPTDVVARACQLGSARGATVVLNLAPAVDLPPGTLAHVDVLVLNRSEAEHLAQGPVPDVEAARRTAGLLRSRGPGAVVITLGRDGVVLADGDGTSHTPAHDVPVVDTTGAGDAFVGVLAAHLSRGGTLADGMVAATGAAAQVVGERGAQLRGDQLLDGRQEAAR